MFQFVETIEHSYIKAILNVSEALNIKKMRKYDILITTSVIQNVATRHGFLTGLSEIMVH